jgi:hypothetical protein
LYEEERLERLRKIKIGASELCFQCEMALLKLDGPDDSWNCRLLTKKKKEKRQKLFLCLESVKEISKSSDRKTFDRLTFDQRTFI